MTADGVASTHPKDFDYSDPRLECDIIMKGGITSGVVYPWAVCELAKTYRFRCVGGTSAGAIAAAATAAAEYGRGTGGFQVLAELPEWLGAQSTSGRSNLFALFQPQESTRATYQTVVAGIGKKGLGRWIAWSFAAATRFWFSALLGAVLGGFIIAVSLQASGALGWLGAILGVLLLVVGAVLGGAIGMVLRALSVVPANGFGMCRGHSRRAPDEVQLTTWLDERIRSASGVNKKPLTFGMLWAGPDGKGSEKDRAISLEVMTTDVTEGLPAQMPWSGRRYFFDPDEFREYFPDAVVSWMEDCPPSLDDLDSDERRSYELQCRQMLPLSPLPDAEDLPVLVAARMSLSFPLLISAVPLYEIDWTRTQNALAEKELRAWIKAHAPEDDDHYLANATTRFLHTKHWFSDGGICSNFPVHLFDAPLPSRPTFALNLRGFHPDHQNPSSEADKVFLPTDNKRGYRRWQYYIAEAGWDGLSDFFGAIFKTMQNWQDNSLVPLAGYRDRIVHVSLSAEEGGMNLDMGEDKIHILAERGRLAAVALTDQFAGRNPGHVASWGWTNHRWTRYRIALAELQKWLSAYTVRFEAASTPDTPGYREAIVPGAAPGTHGFGWPKGLEEQGEAASTALVDFSGSWPYPPMDLSAGAPKTRPIMRLVWRPGRPS